MAYLGYKTGLVAWHEAGLTLGYSDGVAMPTFWIDETGTGAQSFQISAGGPLLKYNQLNGHPSVRFAGSPDYYSSTANLSAFMSAAQGTVFVVFKCTSTPSNDANIERNTALFATGDVGANTNHFMGLHLRNVSGTTPTLYAYGFDGATKSVAFTLPRGINEWGIAIWAHGNSGNLYVGYNDENSLTAVGCGNLTSVAIPPRIAIGTNNTGNNYFVGDIAAILCYTSPMLTTLQMATVLNYLRAKYFSANTQVLTALTRADSLEQARAVVSDHVWKHRRSVYVMTTPPIPLHRLPAGGVELAQELSIVYPYAPDPQGAATQQTPTGWGTAKWARGRVMVKAMTVDLDNLTATLELRDQRLIKRTYAESFIGQRSLNLQRQGDLVIGKAPARAFFRDGYAWVPDVVSGLVTRIDPNQEKQTTTGLLLEPYARNELARSSFVSGATGLTSSGTGVNGSAIALDTAAAYMLFDTSVTTNSLKLTAGNPHTTDLFETWPAFTSPGAINVYFSLDYYSDSGQPVDWFLQRSSDSQYWDDTNLTWQVAKTYNSFAASSSTAIARGQSHAIAAPATGTMTLSVGHKSGGTAGRITHLYHAQIESWIYIDNAKRSAGGPTSRIVTDATAGLFRGADVLRIYEANGLVPTSDVPWTILLKFKPVAIAPTTDFAILGWGTSSDAAFLEWNNAGSQLRLNMSAGAAFATVPWTPAVGTTYKIALRYCPNGEWGNSTNAVDIFLNGTKGTGTTRSMTYTGTMIDFSNMLRNLNNNGDQVSNACGTVSSFEVLPVALTDQEIATW